MKPSDIFKALSVETRIKIIEILKQEGSCGTKLIADKLGITPSAASQHLKILKYTGLVKGEREGYWMPYSIDEASLEKCRLLLNEFCTCGCNQKQKESKKSICESDDLDELLNFESKLQKQLTTIHNRINTLKVDQSV